MHKYAIDDIVMGILSIAVPVVIVLSIGYYAAEKKEREAEFVKADSNHADKLLLCATSIHILEREVDMLKGRVEDLEICATNSCAFHSSAVDNNSENSNTGN